MLGLWVSKKLKRRLAAIAAKAGVKISDVAKQTILLGLDAHENEGVELPRLDDHDET